MVLFAEIPLTKCNKRIVLFTFCLYTNIHICYCILFFLHIELPSVLLADIKTKLTSVQHQLFHTFSILRLKVLSCLQNCDSLCFQTSPLHTPIIVGIQISSSVSQSSVRYVIIKRHSHSKSSTCQRIPKPRFMDVRRAVSRGDSFLLRNIHSWSSEYLLFM